MKGNDFIMFKHGCGNDSMYVDSPLDLYINWDAERRFDKPCTNITFHHVEVEYVGNKSFIYNFEDDSNPIIFQIRKATLKDWDVTTSGKEEIWFDRESKITLKSDRNKQASTMRSVVHK